jgi:hypothetical protein
VEPAPPVRAALRPSTPKAAFDLGPAVAGSTSEVGPSIHATVGVRWFAHPRWSLGLRGLAPTVPPRIASDLGSAAITIAIVDLGAHVGLRPVSKIVQPEVATAVGLAIIRTDGVAVPPARGTTDHIVTASLRLQAGLAVAVHPRMRLRIDGSVGVLLPRPSVVFVDREVAVWGQPYGIGSLGVEVLFD